MAVKRKIFRSLRSVTKHIGIQKQMKHFSRYFFIDKVLKKTIKALYHNAVLSKLMKR